MTGGLALFEKEQLLFVTTGFGEDLGLTVGSKGRGTPKTLLFASVWRPEEAATRAVASLGFGTQLGLFTAADLTGAETLPLRGARVGTPVD
jgi:hypothetical protein